MSPGYSPRRSTTSEPDGWTLESATRWAIFLASSSRPWNRVKWRPASEKPSSRGFCGSRKPPAARSCSRHGSGSGRSSPRNRFVADVLDRAHLATLLFDLLTAKEEQEDERTARLRFNIPFLAKRLVGATDWLCERTVHSLPIGYFGASTGAAAALVAVTERPDVIQAVVSRGGRPDLAGGDVLACVKTPTLFIVGGEDLEVLELNRRSLELIPAAHKDLVIVPRAGHLFEEPGALAEVADHAVKWFKRHLLYGGAPEKAEDGHEITHRLRRF